MAKPFSIQAPENIAKEYAGNKQKIAQAAQMGILDPTAAVLAGMFIDRMRSAQVMEGGQQPTVAQQVLGGQPQTPPMGAPPAPAQGMGAPPPMGPPPMGPPPQEMPSMAEGGMVPPYAAGGGLSELPVPDTMFDEPSNGGFDDGYAGGGMVAFAPGGSTGGMANLYDDVEYWESGGKQGAVSKAGARGVMQLMPGTMKDPGFGVAPMRDDSEAENRRAGREYLDAMYRRYGDEATALAAYNWGPGNVDKWLKKGGDPKQLPAETKKYISNILGGKANPKMPERNTSTAEGRASSVEDQFQNLLRRFGPTAEEQDVEGKRMARAKEMGSDEYYEKQRKDSMWETLANIGFNMASSKSPYLLQAVGEAAAAAMPGARADKKERKALKDRALDIMGDINGLKRKENLQLFGMAVELEKEGRQQEQFEQKMNLDERQVDLAERRLNAELAAAAAKGEDVNDRVTRYLLDFAPGTAEHEAAKRVYEAKRPPSEGGAKPFDVELKGVQEGATAKDTSGKTIVFSNGQWVYP